MLSLAIDNIHMYGLAVFSSILCSFVKLKYAALMSVYIGWLLGSFVICLLRKKQFRTS